MKKKKKKVNFVKVLLAILLFFVLIFMGYMIIKGISDNDKIQDDKLLMKDVTMMNIDEVKSMLQNYDLSIDIKYEYSDTILKDMIISQSIDKDKEINEGDKLQLVVSLGKIDKEKLAADGINELGKVPIMMYHGIKNIKSSDTKYIGGNVDKDGYTRTAEAFREDLEFYYQKGYRMVKLSDYVNGDISVEYGYSPIVLTFDDGNDNNIKVNGLDQDGNIIIYPDSAVGILEEFKKIYPDYGVTVIFFVNGGLFNQPEYNDKIINWLVDNGYEVGNHTRGHENFTKINTDKTQEVVGYMYNKLESIIGDKYSKIVALPFGSPYNKTHQNYKYIINGEYNGEVYETVAALRVGWEPEVSPYDKEFDKTFLKRCRAYDNNGKDFDIEMVFRILDKTRYISDGNKKTIVASGSNSGKILEGSTKEVILYE